jgi:Uma2 family endonuclease
MTTPAADPVHEEILYPDSDGQPMSDNTLQYQWIVTIHGNLDAMYPPDANVFVAADLLWYPVEGEQTIRAAPDDMVVFGRPKGYRGSYQQWREGGIAPQVAFEILSPSNRPEAMQEKFEFYERYGVEEYYVYDPHRVRLTGYRRVGSELQEIETMDGWVSPRLGIRFDLSGLELVIWRPNHERFLTFAELEEARKRAREQTKQAMELAEQERRQREEAQARAEQERQQREEAQARAEQERQQREEAQARAEQERRQREEAQARAEQERQQREEAQARAEQERRQREEAQARAEQERRQREEAQARAERLAARLRDLGIDPEQP